MNTTKTIVYFLLGDMVKFPLEQPGSMGRIKNCKHHTSKKNYDTLPEINQKKLDGSETYYFKGPWRLLLVLGKSNPPFYISLK